MGSNLGYASVIRPQSFFNYKQKMQTVSYSMCLFKFFFGKVDNITCIISFDHCSLVIDTWYV